MRRFSGSDLVNHHRLRGCEHLGYQWTLACDPFWTMPESNSIVVEQSDLQVMYPELSLAKLSAISQEREELNRELGQGAPRPSNSPGLWVACCCCCCWLLLLLSQLGRF